MVNKTKTSAAKAAEAPASASDVAKNEEKTPANADTPANEENTHSAAAGAAAGEASGTAGAAMAQTSASEHQDDQEQAEINAPCNVVLHNDSNFQLTLAPGLRLEAFSTLKLQATLFDLPAIRDALAKMEAENLLRAGTLSLSATPIGGNQ